MIDMWSIVFEYDASIFLHFVTRGVDMGLQSIILNLRKISTAYFPCIRKKHPSICYTSNPRK
jgi:hypothetical protein